MGEARASGIKRGSMSTGSAGQGWALTIMAESVLVIFGCWFGSRMAVSFS